MRHSRQSTQDLAVQGSALSLHATPMRARAPTENYVSVRELCANGTQLSHPLVMDDQTYTVPTFSWKKPKFTDYRERRLDYLLVFAEKDPVKVPEKLLKMHPKKKHSVPGPTAYELTKDWAHRSGKDYEQQRGKTYRQDRETDTAKIIRHTKRDKLPAPNQYKPKSMDRICGLANCRDHQLKEQANWTWFGKQTPGFVYHPSVVSFLVLHFYKPFVISTPCVI